MSDEGKQENFISKSEKFINDELNEKHRHIAKEVLDFILKNYGEEIDYSVSITSCIPIRLNKSNHKSVSISRVNDELLLHYREEHRVVGINLLSINGISCKQDPYSKTQLNVKYNDIKHPRNLFHAIEYTLDNPR